MAHVKETELRAAKVAVITVSDTRTAANDTSGDLIVSQLESAGHEIVFRSLIKDDLGLIRQTVRQQLDARTSAFIIITGGTGLSPRDVTVEAIQPLYSKHIPGFGELFRYLSYADIGTATIQSRADAGLCDHAVVFALPGSTGACRLALEKIILPQIDNTQGPCNFRTVIADP
jgi:molybdenum cofactor biosynthesis protein B